ncbi:tRNA lysidine(34) synthetase TilS [Postechiella marina]|uniref:tRNA(Ile)-lysidine synthase n=1 Tax=Postechiella marina TaxID=943941 RepID=A0ABP8BZ69_9FLAO
MTLQKFEKHIKSNLNFLTETKLLIAISGGLDSVVLTELCSSLNMNVALAHCNFNLRASESDGDEAFVLKLAERLNLEVFIESFDTNIYAKNNKLSIQIAARELRYNWFKALANQLEFDYILTAHHADDNLETFLINLSRGTGLEGLKGIPEINNNIVRPLLPFSREAIIAYAENKKLSWREDSSNASTKYTRNKLRHDVIPVLKEMNPQFLQNFNKTQAFLKDSEVIIKDRIEAVSNTIISFIDDAQIQFNINDIKALSNPKAYLYEMLKPYNFTEWNDVVNLLEAQSGKHVFSETHRLLKDRHCLILTEIEGETQSEISILKTDKKVETPFGILLLEDVDTITEKQPYVIYVDKALVDFPLQLRPWQEGDYFYPLGMSGKKKLSKYFKDEKLSILDKENVWLLCSGNKIVWVVNRRADNRFKVNKGTSSILKIEIKN